MIYNFDEKLAFSRGRTKQTHPETIRHLIPKCSSVAPQTLNTNDHGIDFVATLDSGRTLNIDIKARESGCSKFWKQSEPELSLEIWSVKPEEYRPGIVGWTLDSSKSTDYTLHVFDPTDTNEVFLLPFTLLRLSFQEYGRAWCESFQRATQESIRNGSLWKSECVFVPGWCIIDAITEKMRQTIGSF